MAYELVVSSENGKRRSYPVGAERMYIGRHPKNVIVLETENVSVSH